MPAIKKKPSTSVSNHDLEQGKPQPSISTIDSRASAGIRDRDQ